MIGWTDNNEFKPTDRKVFFLVKPYRDGEREHVLNASPDG